MGSKIGHLLGALAPVAASFIPGIGPLGVAAIGAGGGLLGGGGVKGALAGGLTGYGLGGGSSILGKGLSSGLGLGLEKAGQTALGGGLLGATAGGLTGGVKGAAIGGGIGGLGGYASGGGFDGTTLGDIFGHVAQGQGPTLDGTPLNGGGSGIAGAISRNVPSLGTALSGGAGGGSSSYLPALAGGAYAMNANSQAQKDLLKAQQESLNTLQPYLNSGSAANSKLGDLLGLNGGNPDTASILASDPSYKFQLDQGNQALDRANASRGGYFSGAALKQAQDYGQGLANKTVNDYYNKLAQQSGAGQSAANSAGQIYGDTGSTKANAGISSANIVNQTLGSLFGSGAYKRNPYATGY